MEKKLRDIQQQYNKQDNMTFEQKINKMKQFGESLGLPYNYDFSQQPEDSIWRGIPLDVEKDAIKQFYIRKSWHQKYESQLGFDWFLQQFPYKYPNLETKQDLDKYMEEKVKEIRARVANGERAENDQQRKARHQKDDKYWKDKQNQYNTITGQKQFVLFEVTKEQAEWFFNQHNRMISEYRLVNNTQILSGIHKYKAIKYTLLTHQTGIPQVNMSLCDIYLNVIQD